MPLISKNSFIFPIIISLETILVYIFTVTITEYFYTYKNCQFQSSLDNNYRTLILFIIFTIVLTLNLLIKKIRLNSNLAIIILLIISSLSIISNKTINSIFVKKFKEITICALSTSWGIQGKEIIIYGQNFSPEWQPGQVLVNDFPLRVLNWTESKIIVEQPVPNSYFKGELFVVNFDGQKSNSKPFEIMNPDNLSKVDQYILKYQFYKNK